MVAIGCPRNNLALWIGFARAAVAGQARDIRQQRGAWRAGIRQPEFSRVPGYFLYHHVFKGFFIYP
jgi:hypothetical protein